MTISNFATQFIHAPYYSGLNCFSKTLKISMLIYILSLVRLVIRKNGADQVKIILYSTSRALFMPDM